MTINVNAQRFICDTKNETFRRWVEETHPAAIKEKAELAAFLDKQIEALKARWTQHWNDLFSALQKEGVVDPSLKPDEWQMHLTDDSSQFFISRKDATPDFREILAHLMNPKG